MNNYKILFLSIYIMFFVLSCLIFRDYIDYQTVKNERCGHMKTIIVVKTGYAFDGFIGDVGCFGEWTNNGKRYMTTFWNVGDCLDDTPIPIQYPDYEC